MYAVCSLPIEISLLVGIGYGLANHYSGYTIGTPQADGALMNGLRAGGLALAFEGVLACGAMVIGSIANTKNMNG